ncbi:hypothetical protein [Acidovorax sp. SDU_ACID1]|uniref:hypothetical protein n=1 Tax=Acidovorax sp. SDU_ACID1 TaxID=3136632 RepID=UPI003873B5DE
MTSATSLGSAMTMSVIVESECSATFSRMRELLLGVPASDIQARIQSWMPVTPA